MFWLGIYVNPQQSGDDTFSTGFRQLKAYVSQLLNIGVQYRIDSDVNKQMVYRLIWKYITQHPYTNKLIINIFNAGDAAVFADNLVMLNVIPQIHLLIFITKSGCFAMISAFRKEKH